MSVVRTEILRYYAGGEGGKPVAATFPRGWREVVIALQADGLLEFCGGDNHNDYYVTTERGRLLLDSETRGAVDVSAYFGGGDNTTMGPYEARGLIHDDGTCDLSITDPEFLDYCGWDLDERGPFVFNSAPPFNGTVYYDSFAWGPPRRTPKTRFERAVAEE